MTLKITFNAGYSNPAHELAGIAALWDGLGLL